MSNDNNSAFMNIPTEPLARKNQNLTMELWDREIQIIESELQSRMNNTVTSSDNTEFYEKLIKIRTLIEINISDLKEKKIKVDKVFKPTNVEENKIDLEKLSNNIKSVLTEFIQKKKYSIKL